MKPYPKTGLWIAGGVVAAQGLVVAANAEKPEALSVPPAALQITQTSTSMGQTPFVTIQYNPVTDQEITAPLIEFGPRQSSSST